jgi:hypothetical protein
MDLNAWGKTDRRRSKGKQLIKYARLHQIDRMHGIECQGIL